MTLKLRATHLAPPAYAHLKEFVVLSGNWQIGSISEKRAGKGWFWALGVGSRLRRARAAAGAHGPHKLSMDLRAAEDRTKQMAREVEHWRDQEADAKQPDVLD